MKSLIIGTAVCCAIVGSIVARRQVVNNRWQVANEAAAVELLKTKGFAQPKIGQSFMVRLDNGHYMVMEDVWVK